MSIKVKVYNQSAEALRDIDLSPEVFALEANHDLIHQAALAQAGNERQVLAHAKDRSEVAGGGKKPWKQKGTGRARAGSSRSPIWIGGGVTFGPSKDRNFSKNLNKKMRQKALKMLLSDKVKHSSLVVLDNLKLAEYKTKDFIKVLEALEKSLLPERRSLLILSNEKDEKLYFSARNLKGVKVINLENINILDLLNFKHLLINEDAIKSINKQYSRN